MATTRNRRTLAERLADIEKDRQRLLKAKVKEDATIKREAKAAELADQQLRGTVTERRREAAWKANPEAAQAERALLDQELINQDERRVFGLKPLNATARSGAPDKNGPASPAQR